MVTITEPVTTRIFSGTTSTGLPTLTDPIGNASVFWLVAPDTADEIEIDMFLQLELGEDNFRLLRLDTVRPNTEGAYRIPREYLYLGKDLRLALFAGAAIALEVWIVEAGIPCPCSNDVADVQRVLNVQSVLDLRKIYSPVSIGTNLQEILSLGSWARVLLEGGSVDAFVRVLTETGGLLQELSLLAGEELLLSSFDGSIQAQGSLTTTINLASVAQPNFINLSL